jgi:N-acyl-D-aspartate/D-glutamate deacylase
MARTFDLLVRGGSVVDGTGAPVARTDVGVREGRVAAVGPGLERDAVRVVEADGRVVAPGFVDIHTHYDAQLLWDRMLTISPWHGVTSVVVGNCGFGIAPTRPSQRDLILRTLENVEGMALEALRAGLGSEWGFESFPEYLDAIEARGTAINVGALLGHTPLRLYAMGEESTEREATADEIGRMQALVGGAMRAGALGFATSKAPTHVGYAGRPVPSRAAALSEIEALAGVLAGFDHGVVQATLGAGFLQEEFAAIARANGKPFSWTALLAGAFGPEGHRGLLEQAAKLQAEGTQVVPQVSGRPLLFEFQWKAPFPFESMPLFQPVSAADLEGRKRIYADPGFRRALRERREPQGFGVSWDRTLIAECPGRPELAGRTVADVAAEQGVHPSDLALDLGLATGLEARFRSAIANADEDIVAELISHPAAMLGLSDAGAHASQLCDACFATHLLGHWVREKGVLRLEEAVRLLTSRSADVFGLRDRGRIAPGLAADLVVFDPATVGCGPLERVHDLPGGADRVVSRAYGVDAVIVNGVVLREGGLDRVDPDGPLPGRLLRGGRDPSGPRPRP